MAVEAMEQRETNEVVLDASEVDNHPVEQPGVPVLVYAEELGLTGAALGVQVSMLSRF